jgi:hypothetical protein
MANIGVDITNPAQDESHYMPGTCKKAEGIINRSLEMAIQLGIAGLHDDALYFLGAGLHTVQDKFAHFEQNAGWAGHFRSGPSPDDPVAHPIEYLRARKASADYIGRFIEEVIQRRAFRYR